MGLVCAGSDLKISQQPEKCENRNDPDLVLETMVGNKQ
jgi:hypothetical protein